MKMKGFWSFVFATLLFAMDARATEEECLTRAEAEERWPGAPLVVKRHIKEIGVVGGLGMGFFVEDGALVANPDPGGPAARAGIRRNDRIVAVGEKAVAAFADDREIVRALRGDPGTSVTLSVERWVRLERSLVEIVVVRAAIESVDFSYCWSPDWKHKYM